MLCAIKRRAEPQHTSKMRHELNMFWLYSKQIRRNQVDLTFARKRIADFKTHFSPWLLGRLIELEGMLDARLSVRVA